jgi:hypothetical protein
MATGLVHVGNVDCYTFYGRHMWLVPPPSPGPGVFSEIFLPRTGNTDCYLDTGPFCGAETKTCEGSGQDGDIRAGAAWPEPRFTDTQTRLSRTT